MFPASLPFLTQPHGRLRLARFFRAPVAQAVPGRAVKLALECLRKLEAGNVAAKGARITQLEARLATAEDELKKMAALSGARLDESGQGRLDGKARVLRRRRRETDFSH